MAQTLDSQGNVIANGYSTNLNPTQYASQNSSPAVPVPTTINSSSLRSTTPVPTTAPVYDTAGYQNSANSSQAYTASALAEAQRQAEQAAQLQRDNAASANTDIGRLSSTLNGGGTNLATSTVNQAYNEGGVNDKLSILNRLNAESQGIGYRNTTIPLELQNKAAGTGMTDRGLAPLQTKELRDNAIQLASNAYQSAIARNDYETAKSKADQMIAYKYDTTLAEINAKKTNLENIRANLTVAEKKVADATTARLNKEKADAEKKMADEKAVSDMIIQASQVAPADVLKRAKDLQVKGATPTQVAMALGVYGGDYYKTALLKEQIETQKSNRLTDAAQRAKIYQDMAVTTSTQSKAEADSWVANIASGKAKISDVPAKLKGLVSIGLSTATITSPENKAKIESSQAVYDLAEELKTLSGKGGAIGAGVGKTFGAVIPGYGGTAFAGSDRANYEAKFKQLKDTLAASNLDKLKGAMSDKDIEFLRNIGTALNESMSESAFDAELNKVQNTMSKVPGVKATVKPTYNKFNSALGQSATPIGGTTYVKSVGDDGSIDFNIPTN